MSKSWWHNTYRINGKEQTPTEYLKVHYNDYSDREIAQNLTVNIKRNVTREAVKKRRYRLNLYKEDNSTPTSEFTRDSQSENYQEISFTQEQPLTLEDLVKLYQIDLAVWEVDSFKVNSWQVGAKAETKDLTYIDGKVSDGTIKSDGLTIKTLYQTKASFMRKVPLQLIPTIHPIQCDREFPLESKVTRPAENYIELVISDPHFGYKRKEMYSDELVSFHDERVLDIFIKACELIRPAVIRVLGDIFDFPEFSDKFLRSPEFAYLTQPAINAAHSFFFRLRKACPQAQIIINDGNHDKRLSDMIVRHLPFVYGLRAADELELPPALSVPKLLALHKLNIYYTDTYPNDFSVSDNGLCEYSHGEVARTKPYATVSAVIANSDISRFVGHVHRIESAYKTIWRGGQWRIIQVHSFGCACKIDGNVPGRTARQNWQNGFGVVYHTPTQSNGTAYLIDDGKCLTPFGMIEV